MRKIAYGLFALLCIALISWQAFNAYSKSYNLISKNALAGYRHVNTYVVDANTPLRFEYPKNATAAKFLFHAVLRANDAPQHSESSAGGETSESAHLFAIDITSSAKEVTTSAIDFSAQVSDYSHIKSGEDTPFYKLDDAERLVSDGRNYEVSLIGLSRKRIKVSLRKIAPSIEKIIVRSFYRTGSSTKNAKIKWARFSRREQTRLARYHPLGRDFLSDEEIVNVLNNRNLAIAPAGIDGVDFTINKLQVFDNPEELLLVRDDNPEFLPTMLGPNSHRSLRILEATNVLLLANASQISNESTGIFYINHSQDRVKRIELSKDELLNGLSLSPGDYSLGAYKRVRVEIEDNPSIDSLGISFGFLALSEQATRFTLYPSHNGGVQLRVQQLSRPDTQSRLGYQFKDAGGKVLLAASIVHKEPLNSFLHAKTGSPLTAFSSISESYIDVPETATELIIKADTLGFVRISNSLSESASKISIDGVQTSFLSKWFEIAPIQGETEIKKLQLIDYGRYKPSPKELAENIQALIPAIESGKRLKTVRAYEYIEGNSNEGNSPIVFSQIRLNTPFSWALNNTQNLNDSTIRPRLFYINTNQQPSTLSLEINNKRLSYALPYDSGELSLPNLTQGTQSIVAKSAATPSLFINYASDTEPYQSIKMLKKREMYEVSRAINLKSEQAISSNQLIQIIVAQENPGTRKELNLTLTSNTGKTLMRRSYSVSNSLDLPNGLLTGKPKSTLYFLPTIYLKPNIGEQTANEIEIEFFDDKPKLVAVRIIDRRGQFSGKSYRDTLVGGDATQ